MEAEIWVDIPNYETLYQVSNLGNVKSLINNRILKQFPDRDGYMLVSLYKNKKYSQHRVHRLVAQAFIPNYNNLPLINHKNEIKSDNRIGNLEWCDAKYNCNYGTRNEKIRKKVIQYTLNGDYIKTWNSIIEVEKELNIHHSRIIEVCKNKRKQIGGYIWRYADEI